MPNILLEYSSNVPEVNFADLFAELHRIMHETVGIRLNNCKSRARKNEDYYIADGSSEHAYVQLTAAFMEGRSNEVRQQAGEQCMAVLKQHYDDAMQRFALQITVQISDIPIDDYFKYPEGSLTPQ